MKRRRSDINQKHSKISLEVRGQLRHVTALQPRGLLHLVHTFFERVGAIFNGNGYGERSSGHD